MTRIRKPILLALAAALALASPAAADVVRLRSGETVKGRVVDERTNEQVLVVEDYVTGAYREIDWGAVVPEDAAKLQDARGIRDVVEIMTKCDVIVFRLNDGSETRVQGEVVGEDATTLLLRNRANFKEPLRIQKGRIVTREQGECEQQELKPPEVLADEWKERNNPQDARAWLNYARYCEAVTAYAQAKEGYETAAAEETFLNRKLAQEGAARVDAIIKDAEAIQTINDLRLALGSQQWKRVREGIEGFPTKHPGASEPVTKKLEALKTDFAGRRQKALAEYAGKRLEPIARDLIRKKVAIRENTFTDVQGWIRKECMDQVWTKLVEELQKKDPAVTPEEAKALWEARPKKSNAWKLARYGSGSFIIEQPKVLPKTGSRPGAQQPRSGGSQGPAPNIDLPKPPTRDEWWKDAKLDDRTEFFFALFVDKSGLFEVDTKRDRANCVRCDGAGTLEFGLSTGGSVTVLCPRCGGLRFDFTVRYR